ncbi:MAG: CoA-binding protein [Promethearchaeota archaeon]|jgi:acyl-CoA synthetase (NDP forming)
MNIEEKLRLMKTMFNPKNVAIMGATDKMMKIGTRVMTSVFSCGYTKKVYGINPNPRYENKKIMGIDMYPTLDKCPEKIDLVGLVVPPTAVLDSIKQAIENDISTAAIITAGFGEVKTEERQKVNQELVKVADTGGLIFVGPNSMGFYSSEDPSSPIHLGFGFMIPRPGNLAIVSQSGTMGTMICNSSQNIRHFISSGNEASLILEDYLEYFAQDDGTKTIALFAEGLRGGSRFKEICTELSKKKPVVFLKAGLTATGARAANSHTGSIAGSLDLYKSLFKQTGVIYAENIEEFLYLIKGAQNLLPLPSNNRLRAGIISGGGGFVVHLTDLCEKHGINVVDLTTEPNGPKLIEEISKHLPFYWSHNNPVDMVATRIPNAYDNVMKLMLESDCFDVVITMTSTAFIQRTNMLKPINEYGKKMKEMMSMRRSERLEEVVQHEIDLAHAYPDKKLIYISFSSSLGSDIYEKYDEGKVMVFGGNPENAPIVMKKLHDYQKYLRDVSEV